MERSAKLAGVLAAAAAVLSIGATAGPALASVTSAPQGCTQGPSALVKVADDALTAGMITNSCSGSDS